MNEWAPRGVGFRRLTEVGRNRVAWEVGRDVQNAVATDVVGDWRRTTEIIKELWERSLEIGRRRPILQGKTGGGECALPVDMFHTALQKVCSEKNMRPETLLLNNTRDFIKEAYGKNDQCMYHSF